jgi:glycosyltransferase involved in cell wall biosynthesis
MTPPAFSVCVISKNGAKTLPRLAESLKEFLARGGEWLLCDTGSTDGTPEVARSLGATVYEAGERFMKTIDAELAAKINQRFVVEGEAPIVQPGSRLFHFADARNYAAGLATNDWVCWADSDEAFTKLDIDKMNAIIADPELMHLEYEFVFAWAQQMNPGDPGYPGPSAIQFIQSKMHRAKPGKGGRYMRWTGAIHEVLEEVS